MKDKIHIKPHIIKSGVTDIWINIYINGKLLVDNEVSGLAIDPIVLLKTIKEGGEYFIITCACGNSECAGINKGILVSHENNGVLWKIEEYNKTNITGQYYFELEPYKENILTGITEFLALYEQNRDAQISPFTMEKSQNKLFKIIKELENK
jgi:hypothetical protein